MVGSMRLLLRIGPLLVAGAVGALLGLVCARWVLVGSGVALVPWAAAGICVGALSDTRRHAAARGVVYGFALAYVFMVAGYDGTAALHTRLAPFLLFGAVGAGCGAVLAVAGFALRGVARRRAHEV